MGKREVASIFKKGKNDDQKKQKSLMGDPIKSLL